MNIHSFPRKLALSLCVLFIFPFIGTSQTYSATDKKNILSKRKETTVAIEQWDRKKLYYLGSYFESIYDKYKDSSLSTAIRCYSIAASSESEYLDIKECYKAAYRLGKIYEQGKGVQTNPHRAMIYYYLSDSTQRAPFNQLGSSTQPDFQRLGKEICGNDYATFSGDKNDTLMIGYSPFCPLKGKSTFPKLDKLGEYLKGHPQKNIEITFTGDNTIMAAQYDLKVESFVIPGMYSKLVSYLEDKQGISPARVFPFKIALSDQNNYMIIMKIVD